MRRVTFALLCSALSVNAGCSTIRDEVRYPGGASGRVLDSRTFDASRSKQLQLLRATLAIAIAARIGEGVISPEDGDAFARQLAEASIEVNYAAADAGFPVYVDGQLRTACTIGAGSVRSALPPTPAPTPTPTPTPTPGATPAPSPYVLEDAQCIGYFTNFESNMARIESRVLRAMLTALPADRAREFLADLTKGDLLSALWSFARASGDVAGAFHRGSGAYRAGVETLAAATPLCDFDPAFDASVPERNPTRLTRFDERYDTVMVAAACLNLSPQDLFDDDDIAALKLPNQVPHKAFHALFRVARSACVGVPLLNAPNDPSAVIRSMNSRRDYCELVRFEPRERPHVLKNPAEGAATAGQQQVQGNPPRRPDAAAAPLAPAAGAEGQQNRNPAPQPPPLPQPSV